VPPIIPWITCAKLEAPQHVMGLGWGAKGVSRGARMDGPFPWLLREVIARTRIERRRTRRPRRRDFYPQ